MKKVKLFNSYVIGVERLCVPPPGYVKFQVREEIPTANGKSYWGRLISLLLCPQEVKDLIRALQEELEGDPEGVFED